MDIPKNIKDDIWQYCMLNDITDINEFIIKMLTQGFNTQKYGSTPFDFSQKEKEIVEKEVIVEVEKIKEVIVEVEKIKEVFIEVPVEKIVTKIEYICDKNGEDVLVEKIKLLEIENESLRNIKPIEIEKIKEVYIKDDELILKLKRDIENLKIEIELEKNRNYQTPKKDVINEKPKKTGLNSIINWVSKTDRGEKDIYGD